MGGPGPQSITCHSCILSIAQRLQFAAKNTLTGGWQTNTLLGFGQSASPRATGKALIHFIPNTLLNFPLNPVCP
jgi:hypothetical protein